MKRQFFLSACVGLMLLSLFACANPATDKTEAIVQEAAPEPTADTTGKPFIVNDESTIGFTGSKVTGSHEGGFSTFNGEILVTGGTPEGSSVKVVIEADSLWADDDRLTGHLKSPDFFDVATHPKAVFKSTAITKDGESYSVTGNLTLHGVTKSITFPAEISVSDDEVSASAEFFVKRFDFGIVYPGKANDLIRDEVVIRLDLIASPFGA